MCFSPAASFVTAGLTGTIGILALTKAKARRDWPLASVPIFFAVQQTIEGLLWLDLPSDPAGAIATEFPLLFLFFAEVFWPVYVPFAVVLVEPDAPRRRLMLVCLAVGLVVSTYLLCWILWHAHSASIIDGHIVYQTGAEHSGTVAIAYLAATGLPAMLSSRRTLLIVGSIILIGSAVSYAFYWQAFVSVWCFFAAAASAMILYHFERSRFPGRRIPAA